jgi:DeoR/GlpR family transcriptional regulator of sugar metabolism
MRRMTKDTGGPPLLFDRRRKILGIVNQRKSVTVDSLLSALRVSRMTISRDLESLETAGLLKRVRGGAVALSHIVVAPRASRSVRSLTDEQMRIGREASRRVENGDFIIIESGSTCMALVEHLRDKSNLKVATASPMIAMRLAEIEEQYHRGLEIIVSGGVLDVYKNFLLGPPTLQMFENMNVDIAFVSVTAIDSRMGVTADDMGESSVSRVVLEKCGRKTIGLIMSSKFNKVSFYKVTDIASFDEIITDSGLDRETEARFARAGVVMTLC